MVNTFDKLSSLNIISELKYYSMGKISYGLFRVRESGAGVCCAVSMPRFLDLTFSVKAPPTYMPRKNFQLRRFDF